MKKILLSAIAVITFIGASAQVAPDFGFESWTNVPFSSTVQDPNGWASLNALTLLGSPQSVFKETTSPAIGLTSCKITTVKVSGASIPNPFRPGFNFDTVGLVGVGTIATVPSPSIKFGYSISGRPSTLSFSCKYTPMAGDSGFVAGYLTRYNGTSRDTIARGEYATGVATSSYAVNSITMVYNPAFSTVWADTMLVFSSSSIYRHAGAKIGSTMYIDGISWSGYTGINENTTAGSISVFPNPATNQISFTSSVNAEAVEVEVLDITGRKVGLFSMIGNALTIQTSSFSSGMYIYNVLNEKKQIINRGKFEVTK